MDPLSVASGVAGLATLAEMVISRTYNTIIACKHASEDSKKLLHEVQALAGILQSLVTLETKLGATALRSHLPAKQVLACQETLQNIRDKLDKSDPKENGISVFEKAKRTLKWPLSSSEMEKFLSEMERHKSTFDLAMSVDALDAILSSQDAREKTDMKIDDVAQTLERLCKIESTKEERRVLQLIGAGDADEAYRANLKLHQHGTGLWFLEDGKPFDAWLTTPRSKLWVYGIPGAGKTILSALAIGKTAESVSTTHGVVFYYCSHRDEQSRKLTGILRCLIGQLARQNRQCMTLLEEKLGHQDHTSAQTWTRDDDELQTVLHKMIRRSSSVSIVIDGIDECHEAATVTDTLATLASESQGARILIFSRKEAEMEPFLDDYVRMSIAAESQDLRLYVPAQIEARSRLRKLRIKDPNVKDKIIEALVNNADGMFRWVACQLDHLCDLTTDDERLSALKRLPRSLESTYDRILERANDRGESACVLVQRSLLWIIHRVFRPLSIRQLCEAVSIDMNTSSLDPKRLVDAEEILICCSSLIRLSADDDCMESAHFTVEEYLRAIDPIRKPHLARFRLFNDAAYHYKAATCLTALLFESVVADSLKDWASLLRWLRQFPFYFHAAIYWVRYSDASELTETIADLGTNLFLPPTRSNYKVWAHLYILRSVDVIADTLLEFLAAAHPGLKSLDHVPHGDSGLFLEVSDGTLEEQFSVHNTAWVKALGIVAQSSSLHFAAFLRQEHLLVPLTRSPEDLNYLGILGTPLHCALLGDHMLEGIQEYLKGDTIPDWPHDAIHFYGYDEKSILTVNAIVDLGADAGLDFVSFGGKSMTTISVAVLTGHREKIIGAGAVLDQKTADWLYIHADDDDLAYIRAVDLNRVSPSDRSSVTRLLQKCESSSVFCRLRECEDSSGLVTEDSTGPDSSLTYERNQLRPGYKDAIIEACERDNLTMLQWILESSAVETDYEIEGNTPLHMACSSAATSVAKYLISRGAQLDRKGAKGIAPLGLLLGDREQDDLPILPIFTSLIESGANTNSLDLDEHNSLMYWAMRSVSDYVNLREMEDILDTIASSQPDFEQRNGNGQSVWHVLAENFTGLLLIDMLKDIMSEEDIESSINLIDDEGRNALHLAALKGHGDMMYDLINSGCELTASNLESQVVDMAILTREPGLIDAILDSGIDVDERGFCLGNLTILERLCQLSAPVSEIEAALSRTKLLQNHTDTRDSLLHLSLRVKDDIPKPPAKARELVVQLLIEAGVDVNVKSINNGQTPLMLSAKLRSPKIMQLLLDNNADFSLQDFDGRDALLHACKSGRAKSVRSLLSLKRPFVYGKFTPQHCRQASSFHFGPFQAATLTDSIEVLEALHELTEVDKTAEQQLRVPSCLWVACMWPSNLPQIQYLLNIGSEVNYTYPADGTTPLHVAAEVGSVEALEALLEAGAECCAPDYKGLTAEMHAMFGGHREAAEVLRNAALGVSANPSIPSQEQQLERFRVQDMLPEAIDDFVAEGDIQQLKNFVSAGGDLSSRFQACKCTPIISALYWGMLESVEYLQSLRIKLTGNICQHHARSDLKGPSALDLLAAHGTLVAPLRSVLLGTEYVITSQICLRMMHAAAQNGNIDALKIILAVHRPAKQLLLVQRSRTLVCCVEEGEYRSVQVASGTVLHTAVKAGHHEIVRLLLQHYPNLDILDEMGQTLVHVAAEQGQDKILETLLSHGGNVDARNGNMQTPLHMATWAGRLTTMQRLLEWGADTAVVDERGQTLYYPAAASNTSRASWLLLNTGLLPSALDVYRLYWCGFRALLIRDKICDRITSSPVFVHRATNYSEVKAILNLIPLHCRKLNLASRLWINGPTVLYRIAVAGRVTLVKALLEAGAMINQEGGIEGTPLMGACRAGNLDVIKCLIQNGAVLRYWKSGLEMSAFTKAKQHTRIQRWLLVDRFTEQRTILAGCSQVPSNQPEAANVTLQDLEGPRNFDDAAKPTKDLVLEADLELYLESANWFLPARQFVDRGDGRFDITPISPSDFYKSRPKSYPRELAAYPTPW